MKSEEIIIDLLYNKFQQQGYVTEEDIYELCESYNLSFVKTDYVGNQLLARGVLISNDIVKTPSEESFEDIAEDYTQDDYEEIYLAILAECPGLSPLVEYAKKVTLPKKRELKQLFVQIESGNQYAREMLIKKYIRLALQVTFQYRDKTAIPLDDLFSVSMIGVLKAVNTYDIYSNSSFSSYVSLWINNSIDRYISDNEYIIKLPKKYLDNIKNSKETDVIDYNLNVAEIICEISQKFGIKISSLDIELSVGELAEHNLLLQQLNIALSSLSPREREVIEQRYGLVDGFQSTLEEIGRLFSISRERVRQIELKALGKLKKCLSLATTNDTDALREKHKEKDVNKIEIVEIKENSMQITDKEIIKRISSDISTLGTKYIVDMVKLCDKYGIDRDSTLEHAVTDLVNLVKKFSFRSMNIDDKEWNKKFAEIDSGKFE